MKPIYPSAIFNIHSNCYFAQALDGSTSKDPRTEINVPNDVFEKCYEAVKEHDEKFCRELKDEINFLMVVVSNIQNDPRYHIASSFPRQVYSWQLSLHSQLNRTSFSRKTSKKARLSHS
jgi:hypothetical protein